MEVVFIKKEIIELQEKIRNTTEEDKKILPMYSYSGLSMFKHCPYQFNLKYNEDKRADESTLALQLGTLLHYVLEQKGKMIQNKAEINYDILWDIMQNGIDDSYRSDDNEKPQEKIKGLDDLKKEYWETWGVPDSEGRTYSEKMVVFDKILSEEMERDDWKPVLFEHPFEFVYDNKIILHGFIDRVDINPKNGVYRVVDYKTNKKPFPDKELPTALQFGIYALAILNEFGVTPVEFQYRLILLDKDQYALSNGWEKRIITAMDGLVNDLDARKASGEWTPKPTPLCHWCSYCSTNPDAREYKNECPYYSLWTPNNKTYEVNVKYDPAHRDSDKLQNISGQKRKIVVF